MRRILGPNVSHPLYRVLTLSARLAVRSGRSKDLQIIVLRHQLSVLRRQASRPHLNNEDRTLLGAIAAALPRQLRARWIVTPDTLLRWHRRRIARKLAMPKAMLEPPPVTHVDAMTNPPWQPTRARHRCGNPRIGHRHGKTRNTSPPPPAKPRKSRPRRATSS